MYVYMHIQYQSISYNHLAQQNTKVVGYVNQPVQFLNESDNFFLLHVWLLKTTQQYTGKMNQNDQRCSSVTMPSLDLENKRTNHFVHSNAFDCGSQSPPSDLQPWWDLAAIQPLEISCQLGHHSSASAESWHPLRKYWNFAYCICKVFWNGWSKCVCSLTCSVYRVKELSCEPLQFDKTNIDLVCFFQKSSCSVSGSLSEHPTSTWQLCLSKTSSTVQLQTSHRKHSETRSRLAVTEGESCEMRHEMSEQCANKPLWRLKVTNKFEFGHIDQYIPLVLDRTKRMQKMSSQCRQDGSCHSSACGTRVMSIKRKNAGPAFQLSRKTASERSFSRKRKRSRPGPPEVGECVLKRASLLWQKLQ